MLSNSEAVSIGRAVVFLRKRLTHRMRTDGEKHIADVLRRSVVDQTFTAENQEDNNAGQNIQA